MQPKPWRWVAFGALLGCTFTLCLDFTLKKLDLPKKSSDTLQRPTTATIDIEGEPTMGSSTAPITIVEFSDFECPYCKRFHEGTFKQLKKTYIDKGLVRFIHKDLPLPFHSNALLAATTARCAQEEGEYWNAYDALYSQQDCLSCKGPTAIVEKTGVSRKTLEQCSKSEEIRKTININISEAELNGIRATPTFVIGPTQKKAHRGEVTEGAVSWELLKYKIDKHLANNRNSK